MSSNSENQNDMLTIARCMMLGRPEARPTSISESEWERTSKLIDQFGLRFLKDTNYPILRPETSTNGNKIQVSEDRFALIGGNGLQIELTEVDSCLGIVLQSDAGRKMAIHVLNRSLKSQQPTLDADLEEIHEQIMQYWGKNNVTQLTFVSSKINEQVDYQQKLIRMLLKQHPKAETAYLPKNNFVV